MTAQVTAQATAQATGREDRARRLLAFTGVAPLGAFVVVHLIATATALSGAARFDRVFARNPTLEVATVLFVLLPLVFHAAYGTYVAIVEPESIERSTWWPRTRRLAALATLVFLVGHFVELPLHQLTGSLRAASLFDVTAAHLSSTSHGVPVVAIAYLAGLGATLFHFATATWTFVTSWSVVVKPEARRVLAWGVALGASALFALGASTIVFFATGNRLFGGAGNAFVPDGPPPAPCRPEN